MARFAINMADFFSQDGVKAQWARESANLHTAGWGIPGYNSHKVMGVDPREEIINLDFVLLKKMYFT